MELQPEGARPPHLTHCSSRVSGIGRVDEQRHDARRGKQLVQQFQPLRRYLHVQLGHARDVAARPVKAGDEAELDRVAARFEDDRNGRGRCLCRKRRRSAGRGNHGHLTTNQIGRHRRQPIILALRPAVFDRHVVAINVTGFAQPFEKGRQLPRVILGGRSVDKPDHRHRRLLRARRERPRGCRAAEKRDELASLHSIELHGTPASQVPIAVYRIGSGQSAERPTERPRNLYRGLTTRPECPLRSIAAAINARALGLFYHSHPTLAARVSTSRSCQLRTYPARGYVRELPIDPTSHARCGKPWPHGAAQARIDPLQRPAACGRFVR